MNYKKSATSNKTARDNLFVILPLFAVIVFYIWFVGSSSTGTTTNYYTDLADSFLKGKLYLLNIGKDIPIDLSYYNGKFYMYWGPVPALLLAPIQFLSHARIGDFFLALIFGIGVFLAQSFLLIDVWKRYFSTLPKWTIHVSIFLCGLIAPVFTLRHNTDHARIYEAAIIGGQFFLMGGLLMAFIAITKPAISNLRLAVAGLLWVLAIGTRNALAAPIGLMVLFTAILIIRINTGFIEKIKKLISLGTPLFFGFVGTLWYNWARFDSVTETGFSYALASEDLQAHASELFSRSYIFQNLYNYLLNPPGFLSNFPFVSMIDGSKSPILPFYSVPDFYHAQPATGLLFMFPFAVFSVVPLVAFITGGIRLKSVQNIFDGNDNDLSIWLLLNLGASFLAAFGLLLFFFWVGIRYIGDFVPSLVVLSILGFWQGYKLLEHKKTGKNLYLIIGLILTGISIMVSVLLAISTNSELVDIVIHAFK